MNALSTQSRFQPPVWDPFRDFASFEKRLAKMLAWEPMNRSCNGGEQESMTVAQWSPPVDISEDEKEYVVKAELPELKREEVKVSMENGHLIISGERKTENEKEGKKYHRVERSHGSFMRSFTFPTTIFPDKVTAEFKDGLLVVRMPKDETARQKAFDVHIN